MGPAADLFGFGSGGLVPGIGMKFFRTGHPSGNVIMLHSLDSLPGYNFFSVPLSNHIPSQPGSFGTKILEKKFCQTERCISKVGISNLCSPDQDGNSESPLEIPFKISLVPSQVSQSNDEPDSMQDFMERFTSIPIGTSLYTLKAHRNPEDESGIPLGNMITTNHCITSNYGDTALAFKHQWIDDDVAVKPEWSDSYYANCGCA